VRLAWHDSGTYDHAAQKDWPTCGGANGYVRVTVKDVTVKYVTVKTVTVKLVNVKNVTASIVTVKFVTYAAVTVAAVIDERVNATYDAWSYA
jgi:hypothetical protein